MSRRVLRPENQIARDLEQLVHRIGEICPLRPVLGHLLEVLGHPLIGAADLKEALGGRPISEKAFLGLASEILGEEGVTLEQAMGRLGPAVLRDLALATALAEMFRSDLVAGQYHRWALWRHSVAVGLTGRLIGERLRLPETGDLFLAGLFHDIGILFEDHYLHGPFVTTMRHKNTRHALIDMERKAFGFHHAHLGGWVLARWNFPSSIGEAALRHHDELHVLSEDDSQGRVVSVVALANRLCTAAGWLSSGFRTSHLCEGVVARLGLRREDVRWIREAMRHTFTSRLRLFDLPHRLNREK